MRVLGMKGLSWCHDCKTVIVDVFTIKDAARVMWVAAVALFFGIVLARATTVVIFRTNKVVVVGSDSRVIGTDSYTGGERGLLGCKIEQLDGRVFFVAAGFYGDQKRFDVYRIAKKSAMAGGDAIAIANRFGELAVEPFSEFLRTLPKETAGNCEHTACLQVAFVGLINGVPEVAVRKLYATFGPFRDGLIEATRGEASDCPGDCRFGTTVASTLGYDWHVNQLLDAHPGIFIKRGPIGAVDDAINTEIAADPTHVAGPTAILVINKHGPRWAGGHQGSCPDIK